MQKFEYKTLVLPFRLGLFKQGVPDIQSALNAEGRDGWQIQSDDSAVQSVGNFRQHDRDPRTEPPRKFRRLPVVSHAAKARDS
jgi:hypothetical protein